MGRCNIHPKYKAKRPPTSKRAGCICQWIWEQQIADESVESVEQKVDRIVFRFARARSVAL